MTRTPDPDAPKQLRLQDFLPYRLAATSNVVSRLVARAYQDQFGISIWEWRVIAILGEGEPMTAQAISDSAAMDKVSVSRAVRSLDARGLVERKNNAADRRSRLLCLTRDGGQVYDEIAPVALEREAALLAEFTEEEIAALGSMLDRLRRHSRDLQSG